jgi:hypothetical protein
MWMQGCACGQARGIRELGPHPQPPGSESGTHPWSFQSPSVEWLRSDREQKSCFAALDQNLVYWTPAAWRPPKGRPKCSWISGGLQPGGPKMSFHKLPVLHQ